mmetsp:Transcript_22369/g.35808  ORF Transcript_22369/g.35808 Transcript_22369/m.35808 type:complete len:205 (-) Transcript_22369:625-1239(-)
MCRCRGPAHRMHHGSRYGSRHRRRSCRVESNPVRGQRYARCPDERPRPGNNGCQIPWHCCRGSRPEWRCPLSCSWGCRGPLWSARCGPARRWSFPVRAPDGPPDAAPQRLGGWSLRGPGGDQYKASRCHHLPRGPHGRPRFCHRAFWGTSGPLPRFGYAGFQLIGNGCAPVRRGSAIVAPALCASLHKSVRASGRGHSCQTDVS